MRHERPFNYLKEKQIVEDARTTDMTLARVPTYKLMQAFSKGSLKEAIKILEADSSEWALKTLESIRNKDPLAVQITYKLIKKAENLSWV